MKNKFFLGFATMACCSPVAAMEGIWIGSHSKDAMTDKPTSIAYMSSAREEFDIVLRCRSNGPDALIKTPEDAFSVGQKTSILVRIGEAPPQMIEATATEPSILAFAPGAILSLALRDNTAVAIRFPGAYGRQITGQFKAVMKPNSLDVVGRVLADCNVAPFPTSEIEAASKEIERNSEPRSRNR